LPNPKGTLITSLDGFVVRSFVLLGADFPVNPLDWFFSRSIVGDFSFVHSQAQMHNGMPTL
jgi:hypothetical protein